MAESGRGRGRGRAPPTAIQELYSQYSSTAEDLSFHQRAFLEELNVLPRTQTTQRFRRQSLPGVNLYANRESLEVMDSLEGTLEPKPMQSVDLLAPFQSEMKRLVKYRVRRVVSPHEFYLSYAVNIEDRDYDKMFARMQRFYEKLGNEMKVKSTDLITGQDYACMDFKDKQWHRVRLHHVLTERQRVYVWYLDLCKMQETEIKRLRKLDTLFYQVPAQVFRCHLVDIRPDANEKVTSWSPKASVYFKELMVGNEFSGIVTTRSVTLVSEGMSDFVINLGVVLIENDPQTGLPKTDICTVNARLVDAGFAEATGVFASCQHVTLIEGHEPKFEDGALEIPSRVNEFFANEWKWMTDRRLPRAVNAYFNAKNKFLPPEIANRLGNIELVIVQDPSYMIVHLVSRKLELQDMQKEIEKTVENDDCLRSGDPGTFVACHVDVPRDKSDDTRWYRGIIKSAEMNAIKTQYKILLVDYGYEMFRECSQVRLLPPKFQSIPCFAVRVHLDGEKMRPVGHKWLIQDPSGEFPGYAMDDFDRKYRTYIMFKPSCTDILELNCFIQRIQYRPDQRQPIPIPSNMMVPYKAIDDKKGHVMLSSLYRSIGVELFYDMFDPENENFWHFNSCLQDFSTRELGDIAQLGIIKGPAEIHQEIVMESTSFSLERYMSVSH